MRDAELSRGAWGKGGREGEREREREREAWRHEKQLPNAKWARVPYTGFMAFDFPQEVFFQKKMKSTKRDAIIDHTPFTPNLNYSRATE